MNQKDYSNLLNNITTLIIPLNQLLYECLILIVLYNLFNSITFRKISLHRRFIYLITFIFIGIDWFIWNNTIQTSLFACILVVYITYNFTKSKSIATFIDLVNDSRNNYMLQTNINNKINNINNNNKIIKRKEQDEIDSITYIPKNFNVNYNKNKSPDPFNKNIVGLNDLYVAYPSENLPSTHITDSRYAETILNSLYETPQYKKHDFLNSSCKCNENSKTKEEIESDIELFRHPKKEFLDSKWLESKDYKYNDTCSGCMSNKSKGKNAICSVAKFGYSLEECTNQKGTISVSQLDNISNNGVKPIW